jgi:hypothetical protein
MPSYTKKVKKARSDALSPDEEYLGATYALPAGQFGRSLGFGVAGIAGSVAAERSNSRRKTEHGEALGAGVADAIPQGRDVVLAITHKRLLVFALGRMKGNPTDLIAEIPIQDVAGVETQPKKMMVRLAIRFADGSLADFDVQKMAKPSELVAGFERAKGLG